MENAYSIWLIRGLTFADLILTLYATANIFQSIWFRFWGSKTMSDQEKREFFIEKKFDLKWPLALIVVSILGFFIFQLTGAKDLSWWNLLYALLFGLLLWGNFKTYNFEKQRLDRKKDFNI